MNVLAQTLDLNTICKDNDDGDDDDEDSEDKDNNVWTRGCSYWTPWRSLDVSSRVRLGRKLVGLFS